MNDERKLVPVTGAVGRGMIVAAWALLLILLSLLFSDLLERQQNPNQALQSRVSGSGVAEVVLVQNRAGHYVASGKINGLPVTFLLDTGATDVAVSTELAARLKLPRGAVFSSRTANGTVRSIRTHLDQVQLGPIKIKNVAASILPAMLEDEVLLGMSFLRQLELVQRGDRLTVRQH